jgi:hypothetical protein
VADEVLAMISKAPKSAWKRWHEEWLKGIDLRGPLKPITGRRADRKQLLVKSFDKPVRYPTIRGCGHKYREFQQPRHRNCDTCWNAFFFNQKELTENLARNITEQGPEIVTYIQGRKCLTEFLRFARLLAAYEQFRQNPATGPNPDGSYQSEPLRQQAEGETHE